MTAPGLAAQRTSLSERRRASLPAPVLPVRQLFGLGVIALVAVVTELAGRAPMLDPALVLPIVVLAVVVGGPTGGLAAGIGGGGRWWQPLEDILRRVEAALESARWSGPGVVVST